MAEQDMTEKTLESYNDVFADMPLRVISYDGAAYRSQLLKDKKAKVSMCRRRKRLSMCMNFSS